jgi:MFS family permease
MLKGHILARKQGAQSTMTATLPHVPEPRDPIPLVIGAIAAQVIGGLVTQMAPFMISGVMAGLSLSERDSGFVASVEFLTLAATSIVIAPVLPRFSYRRIALVGVLLALFAQAGSIFSASLTTLVLLRDLAGIGEGAVCAVSLSIVASRCSNPDKIYGYFQVVWALGSVALFAVGGQLTAAYAHQGIFAMIAGVTLAVAPLLILIPSDCVRKSDELSASGVQASALLGIITLLAITLYLTVSAGVYAFIAPLGGRAGLDTTAVGYALTIGSLVGLVGALGATALNVRWGRAIPITGSALLSS